MRKVRIAFGRFLYNIWGKYLPQSTSWFKIGQKWFRGIFGRLILKKCGKHPNIERGATFSSSCELGDYSGIGVNAKISNAKIGSHVMMGPNCTIYSRNHRHDRIDIPMDSQGYEQEKQVVVGDDVWIGGNVTILPGVSIGNGSIIGACTVVTKDVPPFCIFCGNPGRVVKYRTNIQAKEK